MSDLKNQEYMKCVEVSKEFFYGLKDSDGKFPYASRIVSTEFYTDVFFRVEEALMFRRSQNNYANYYIVDINS